MNGLNLVIFDMDGVIVDSETLSCSALQQVIAEKFSVFVNPSSYPNIIGKSLKDALKYYSELYGFDFSLNDVLSIERQKDTVYFSIAKGNLVPIEGLDKLLDFLDTNGIKYCVASSGSLEKIKFTLNELNLQDRFVNSVFSSEQVARGKPFPDLFLHASTTLGVSPENCLVVEDSVMGVKAAKAAGMRAVGLCTSFSGDELKSFGADFVVSNHLELLNLFSNLVM